VHIRLRKQYQEKPRPQPKIDELKNRDVRECYQNTVRQRTDERDDADRTANEEFEVLSHRLLSQRLYMSY